MRSKQVFLSALVVLALGSAALPATTGQLSGFTLQVGSFTDVARAERLMTVLTRAGEKPNSIFVSLGSRGSWMRVFVGSFTSVDAAQRYGRELLGRALVSEFIVKSVSEMKSAAGIGPRTVNYSGDQVRRAKMAAAVSGERAILPRTAAVILSASVSEASLNDISRPRRLSAASPAASAPLPVGKSIDLALAPRVSIQSIPRPDPAAVALGLIASSSKSGWRGLWRRGGLWVSGDVSEALARLRWIAGPDALAMISLDEHGKVLIDKKLLAVTAGVDRSDSFDAPLIVTRYITQNEGLLLLAQLTQGMHRYLLHIGHVAPTLGGPIEVGGGVNLDNNYDRRINPHRREGNKLYAERPPVGFDSIVAMNPSARWFNLAEQCMVPIGHVTFHELAEAHAKLDLGVEYLAVGSTAGAHEVALARELRLKDQRPFAVVMTSGSNRVLKSEGEIRQFYLVSSRSGGQR